jgi:LysM repeat protein
MKPVGSSDAERPSRRTAARLFAILALLLVGAGILAVVFVTRGGNSGTTRSGRLARAVDNPKDPYYVVQAGDSFSTIAAKEGVGEALIRRLNPDLDPLEIQPENCLDLVPHGCRRLAGNRSVRHAPNGPKDPYYVVRTGDSLSTIAAKEGINLARMMHLNPRHPNSIQPGDCIDLIRRGCRQLVALKSGITSPPINARIGHVR